MYFCACLNVRLIAVVQAPGAGDGAGLVPGQMQARDPLIPSLLRIKHGSPQQKRKGLRGSCAGRWCVPTVMPQLLLPSGTATL